MIPFQLETNDNGIHNDNNRVWGKKLEKIGKCNNYRMSLHDCENLEKWLWSNLSLST